MRDCKSQNTIAVNKSLKNAIIVDKNLLKIFNKLIFAKKIPIKSMVNIKIGYQIGKVGFEDKKIFFLNGLVDLFDLELLEL